MSTRACETSIPAWIASVGRKGFVSSVVVGISAPTQRRGRDSIPRLIATALGVAMNEVLHRIASPHTLVQLQLHLPGGVIVVRPRGVAMPYETATRVLEVFTDFV